MPPRRGAARAASARKAPARAGGPTRIAPTASPQMLHHQIMRNAYVVAQSQLLQLAKQMEFDADLSIWEEEASEKMQEFWDQSRQNVSDFCARVHSSMEPMPSLAAEVVKSPRKKLDSSMVTAVPTAPPSPTPAPRTAAADDAAVCLSLQAEPASVPLADAQASAPPADAQASVTPAETQTTATPAEAQASATPAESQTSATRAEAQTSATPAETQASAPTLAAPVSESPNEIPLPLPNSTPSTTLRTKRTLGTAVLRSTKKPDTTDEARPPLRPPARFRSSFLNKSLRHAMEERQVGSLDRDLDDSIYEPSPKDASPQAEPPVDRIEPRAVPGPSLDALRTRLENVRRASTTPATTALGTFAAERRASALAWPLSDTPTKLPPADLGGQSRSSRSMGDERTTPDPAMRASPAPQPAVAASVRSENAEPDGPNVSAPATHATPARPRALPPPSVPGPAAAPPTRSPGRERPVTRPMRPRTPGATPVRSGKVGTVAAPPFVQPATPTPATSTGTARGPNATRSPGRLREEKLSPFRASTKEPSPVRSRLPVSPARMGASKIPSPVRKPVPPVSMRAASPESGSVQRGMPARPASVADVRSMAPGLGERLKGLLGLNVPARDAPSRPVSPTARGSDGEEGPAPMPGSFDEPEAPPVRPLSMSTSAVPVSASAPKRPSQAGSTPLRPTPLPKKGVPVRPLARPGSAMRVSSATRPAYTYDTEGKRRKLSQRPLHESTNVEERASTEDALKSKLTTAGGVRAASHTVRVSSSTARNAPTAPRPWAAAQRSSTLSTQNVFQQAAPPAPSADEEELPDVASEYSDSDDEASIRKRSQEPSWTRGRELEALLLQQATVDPDEIFGCQVGPVPLDAMLPPRKGDRRRQRHRTSSANWNGPDGLAQWEIDRYNERMGIHSARTDL
ncbi:Hypothetical protein MSYG_1259 [Malassezia sympodialis ATCC 42132]|uniref:Inner centromere protein ARK-binding domain-containing protein n=1 Tax=Malassezia sympodialis (strain ATCC 42132) TaxID=1230383 RepID=A0A1M8A371_MALS4|nr:Hypothetical protein MSYG_1259 [Malassezia sympodialis ATCC 42132]